MLVEVGKNLFKDVSVFDLRYTPPLNRVFVREEMKEVGKAMSSFLRGLRNHLLITGLPGSGKTLSVKLVCREAKEKFDSLGVYYVACMHADTSFKVLSDLLSNRKEMQGRGFHEGIRELFEMLNENEKNVVVLDDADFLKDHRIIHILTRTGEVAESLRVSPPCTMLIVITGAKEFGEKLPDQTRSSFFPQEIIFGPYSKEEIFKILKMRAEDGLLSGAVNDSVLKLLSRLVAEKAMGDLRVAILSLGKAADSAGMQRKDKVSEKDVVDAFMQARREIERMVLRKLSIPDLVILLACIRAGSSNPNRREHASARARDIYREYVSLTEEFGIISPLNYKSFHNHLNLLRNLSLLSIYRVKSRGVQEKVVEPLVRKHALIEILKDEMKKMYEERTLEHFVKGK